MRRCDLVSIIIPALNEASSLHELYQRTRNALAGIRSFEFIVVDDGSTDDTLDKLKDIQAKHRNVCILSHYRNHGKSLALMQAFTVARGDVAVIMDADLQDQPEMIPRFLKEMEKGFDLINGWRKDRQDSLPKTLFSGIFNFLTLRILKCPVHDINCGFKAMRRTVYKRLELRGDLHRLIPAIVASEGLRVGEIPIAHAPRRYGSSRYRLLRHRGLLDIAALVASNTTQLRPFHVLSEAAIVCWCLAAVALAGWFGLTVQASAGSHWRELVRPLVGLLGMGAALVGTLLPLFGFQLEIMTRRFQDANWRSGLLKERVDTREQVYGTSTASKDIPQQHRLETLLEPDTEPFSLVEGVAAR